MKKLFAFILAFLILFSGCGWNVEIVDPREEPSKPENEAFEPEEPENEVQKTESGEKATFRLGPEGESIELAIGDTIGGWTLESFEKESEGIEAVFAGNISVDCTVEKSPMASAPTRLEMYTLKLTATERIKRDTAVSRMPLQKNCFFRFIIACISDLRI